LQPIAATLAAIVAAIHCTMYSVFNDENFSQQQTGEQFAVVLTVTVASGSSVELEHVRSTAQSGRINGCRYSPLFVLWQ